MLDGMEIEQDPQSRVSSRPDLRTFRLYRTQELIDPPKTKSGNAGVYGRRHVLQLVAIKAMQVHHLPLREIRKRLARCSEADLEMLIGGRSSFDRLTTRTKTNRSRGGPTEKDRRWIMVQLPDALLWVDQAVVEDARPSTLRALGERLTSSILSLRR